MWKITKQYLIDVWKLLWSKTSIDEKAIKTAEEIKKRYKLGIYKIKPGITGLAQINGRDKISVHKKNNYFYLFK